MMRFKAIQASSQTCVPFLVLPIQFLNFTVWNDGCAESDNISLFSHSFLRVEMSCVRTEYLILRGRAYQCDL